MAVFIIFGNAQTLDWTGVKSARDDLCSCPANQEASLRRARLVSIRTDGGSEMRGETAITVYYDGLCPVCSGEVMLYRRLDSCGQIRWRDLAGPDDVLRQESFTRT